MTQDKREPLEMLIPLIPLSPVKIYEKSSDDRITFHLVILRKDYSEVNMDVVLNIFPEKRSSFYIEDKLNRLWNNWHANKSVRV